MLTFLSQHFAETWAVTFVATLICWMAHGFPILAGQHEDWWSLRNDDGTWTLKYAFGCPVCIMGTLARIMTVIFVILTLYVLARGLAPRPA